MRHCEPEDLPRHERYTRAAARARLGWRRGDRRERDCATRMKRLLRRYVGRPWWEASAALDRFCASRHENEHLVARAREGVERGLRTLAWYRYGHPGVRTSEGHLSIGDTGELRLEPKRRDELRTFEAAELRPEPVVMPRGKRKP